MTFQPGTRLGVFEITAKLGEGGMGEVYRAIDTKLDREVAIKVLPAAFTADPDRLARFDREAKLLAQLHHPNIASIFGTEESAGSRALVMELVEGPTLAERLASGALPVEEALRIARQIAEALEEAHEKGIVHRDLKPQNVKAPVDGKVKVLDFGLAKAMEPTGTVATNSPVIMNSPTLTAAHGTALGVILGTAAYMSPEQARGGAVDKRADIWAFGAVLFEMLTGKMAFAAPTVPDTLAAVLTRALDWSALPEATPPAIRQLLRRCLERDPRNRLRDIGDARLAIEEATTTPPDNRATPPPREVRERRSAVRFLPWVVAIAAVGIAMWTLWRAPRATAPGNGASQVTHAELSLPVGVDLVTRVPAGLAVSPDGRTIATIGFREGQRRIYVRRLDSATTTEIKGSSGVNALAFAPDGRSIAFVPGGSRVLRVSLADQQSVTLATCADLRNSVFWGEAWIYYLCAGEIWRVPVTGGAAEQLTHLDAARHEVLHTDPVELPGARFLLFANLADELGTSRIESLSLADGARAMVVENASTPVLSATGHLLFERDGAVHAIEIDPVRATASGASTEVLPASALASPLYGTLAFRLSPTGTLVYMPREFDEKRIVSVARDASERALELPAGAYGLPRVSNDGRRLLFEGSQTVEVFDFARGTRTQIARGTFGTSFPNWTADDRQIVLRRHTVPAWVASDGSGRGGRLAGMTINDYPSPGRDPDSLLTVRIRPETSGDIVLSSMSGAFPDRPLLSSPAYEGGPALSPDGRWLLYQSNESGKPEIYVRAYPALERAWQVSEGGGAQTVWSRDGREIYYRSEGRILAASFDGRQDEPRLGRPAALFADEFDFGPGITAPNYDVTPDGRFIFLRRTPSSGRLHVVLGWTLELERRIAAGGAR